MAKKRRTRLPHPKNPNLAYGRENPNPSLRMRRGQVRSDVAMLWGKRKDFSFILGTPIRRAKFVVSKGKKIGVVARAILYEPAPMAENFLKTWRKRNFMYWTYFPNSAEALDYANAVKHSHEGGLNERFPGSVGIATGRIEEPTGKRVLLVNNVQASFSPKSSLSSRIDSKHFNWRNPVLRTLFSDSVTLKCDRVSFGFYHKSFWEKGVRGENLSAKGKRLLEVIEVIAKEKGFERIPKKATLFFSFRKKS